jgi:hypothetical protein
LNALKADIGLRPSAVNTQSQPSICAGKAILEDLRKQDPEAKPLPNWMLRDLRRIAQSLMTRAGVRADNAERCLGRVMPGVRPVYDPEYIEEMRDAFNKLAAAINGIVHPSKAGVWPAKVGMCA